MYALYKELHPPTSVDHCVSCRFTSETDANVITASGHVLRVYKVRKVRTIYLSCKRGMEQLIF